MFGQIPLLRQPSVACHRPVIVVARPVPDNDGARVVVKRRDNRAVEIVVCQVRVGSGEVNSWEWEK